MDKFNGYNIYNKMGDMVPFVPNEHQKRLFENYYTLDHRRLLIMKARQVGSTTATLAICYESALSGKNILVVLHNMDDAYGIKIILSNFHNGSCCTCSCHSMEIPDNIIITSVGSQIEKCWPSADILYCTEVAWWLQAEKKLHELMQLVRTGGSVIIDSSPMADSWFNNVFCDILNRRVDPSWHHWAKEYHTMLLS